MVLAKVSSLRRFRSLVFFNNPKNLRKCSFHFAQNILLTILWIVFTNLEYLITE